MGPKEMSVATEELAACGYKIDRSLGEGTYGTVVRALQTSTGKLVAIKVMGKSLLQRGEIKKIQLELQAMKAFDHPNIMKVLEVKETSLFIYLVIEYCPNGDLLQHVQAKERLAEDEALVIFRQLVLAIEHAHKCGFIHRDIKLENLLLSQDGSLKVGDWGFARKWTKSSLIREYPGSLHYASPEIVLAKPYVGPEVDIWSMGVTLYALASGCMPFFGQSDEIIVDRIKTSSFPMFHTFSKDLRDLLEKLLQSEATKRFTIQQLKEHPWFSCRVSVNGVNRVRSRSFVYHQGVRPVIPFLNLEETSTFNKLKPDEKIVVTPKGILTHRQYMIERSARETDSGASSNEDVSEPLPKKMLEVNPPFTLLSISPSPSPEPGENGVPGSPPNGRKSKKTKWNSLLKFIGTKASPKREQENKQPKEAIYLNKNKEVYDSPYI